VLHGCIPVLIMDNVHGVFESLLDYSQFSVRVAQADIAKLPAILQAIPASKVLEMQVALARVWHRFAYRCAAPQWQGCCLLHLRFHGTV
jgi:hypothetical protein